MWIVPSRTIVINKNTSKVQGQLNIQNDTKDHNRDHIKTMMVVKDNDEVPSNEITEIESKVEKSKTGIGSQ